MIFNFDNTKYDLKITSHFKDDYKKIRKQGKDINKLIDVLNIIADGDELPKKYKNHRLSNNKTFKDCFECHIEPDWLLVYKIQDDCLVLLLFATGSHAELFKK